MKITQEVRDFAAKQNAGVDSFIAGDVAEAEKGMEEMAEKYLDGRDLYVRAD